MSWYPHDTYGRARWQESRSRIAKLIQGQQPDTLLELDDVQGRLALFQQSYAGVKAIRVDQIVGSVDKGKDFDDEFRPRTDRVKRRWEQVERAFPKGDFPPIDVYQVDETYYVIDGHHRVGIAKAREIEFIDADITELHSPYELEPDVDLADIIHLQQRRLFMQQSGLRLVRPDAKIEFSRPVGWVQLLENLEVHGYHLLQGRDEGMSKERVAVDWYDNVYLKNVAELEAAGLDKLMPHSTVSDLYLWVHRRRQDLFPDRGALTFRAAAESLAEEESRKLGTRAKAALERVEGSVTGIVDKLKDHPDG
ncbi:MAG: ParB N-terminal domain-containing protein [Acidimicrobiia bacterium]|nr:ParB N-terminal domain-containing protein [Acidimicrobiia bacterium]